MRPASRGSGTGRPDRTDSARDVGDGARHRPDGVEGGAEREDAVERDRPHRGLSPTTSQAAEGRRTEQPVSVPIAEIAEAPGKSRRVAAGGATRRPAGVGGVVDGAVPRVRAEHAPGELGQVGLADDGGAGVQHPLDDGRVCVRHMVA